MWYFVTLLVLVFMLVALTVTFVIEIVSHR